MSHSMHEIAEVLQRDLEAGRAVAYCRLVETRGSTPQKAGAVMLVYGNGSQSGTLGGGCVEAEVKRRALAVLHSGRAEISRFQLDNDYGWDDGLICGGRMQVLIEPVLEPAAQNYFALLSRLIGAGEGMIEVVAFDSQSDLPVPSSYLFDEQGQLRANLHGEGLAAEKLAELQMVLPPLHTRPRPCAARGLAYLPVLPRCRLIIVGGGHIGQAVGKLAADLEFDVWVVDDRADFVTPERFPRAQCRISGSIQEVLPNLEIDHNTYCLIVTRGHNHDEEALYYLAERGARYVGLIGSRRKIKMIFSDLLQEGISAEALDQVYAPLGIDIGSQTVPEIAVSICAELVAHRNREGHVPGRPDKVPLSDRVDVV